MIDAVVNGALVKLHYTLTVDGALVDSSRNRDPFVFRVGADEVIPGFEKAIMGMKVGERKAFTVSPDEGYGYENPEGIDQVFKEDLPPDLVPEVGMILYGTNENGKTIPGRITEVREDSVVININHPLAGKTLAYDVEIVEVHRDS